MSSATVSRSARKHRRREKRKRRWIAIPENTYPFETVPFPQPYQNLEPIVNAARYLPWPVPKDRLPCRPWHPEQLWEIGALRKAIFNELCGIGRENGKGKAEDHRTVHCLAHILRCWNTNLKRYDAAGPSFLIHFLKLRYETGFNFWCLGKEDARQVDVLREACDDTHVFSIFLARFRRTACVSFVSPSKPKGNKSGTRQVDSTACWLEDIIHAGEKEVTILPSVTEVDLLNEYYFEDEEPDKYNDGKSCEEEHWSRTVVIVVPNVFVEEFFGNEDPPADEEAGYEERLSEKDDGEEELEEDGESVD